MKSLRIYSNTVERLDKHSAEIFLNDGNPFLVFVEFVCPKSGAFIQDYLTLWKPVKTTGGFCFIAERAGVNIKIPATFDWWGIEDNEAATKAVPQRSAVLIKGEYLTKMFTVNVSRAIRPCTENNQIEE